MTDHEIEMTARRICSALGLDPEERVAGGAYDDDTPAERAARGEMFFVPGVCVFFARWRLYRAEAARAIAAKAAVA